MHSEYLNKHRSCDEIKTNHLIIFYAYYDYLICAFIASMNSNRIEWVDRGFEPRLGPTKNYAIGICCFSVKHAALRGQLFKKYVRLFVVEGKMHERDECIE
jgi:hypothetical protein